TAESPPSSLSYTRLDHSSSKMTVGESSEELFEFEVRRMSFLGNSGYTLTRNLITAAYTSKDFTYRIRKERHGEPPRATLFDASTELELPSPTDALIFYLDDYNDEWIRTLQMFQSYSQEKAAICAYTELCKRHKWVFGSTGWTKAADFLAGLQKTEEWSTACLSQGIFPRFPDVIAKLRSFRSVGMAVSKD
ncbi:MAG: hypothetical protein ABI612_07725, partial [Betaproteobacteria bacterium]